MIPKYTMAKMNIPATAETLWIPRTMKPAVCKPNPPISADSTGTAMRAASGVIFLARMTASKVRIVAKPRMANMCLCAHGVFGS